jgi:hypothetical protein
MEEELKSEGKCLYCDKMFPQNEIGKHLAKHLSDKEKSDNNRTTQTFCHIVVDAGEYFIHLLVKGDASMKVIDSFLKDIWLECCGHMSGFGHNNFKVSMNHKVIDVFDTRIKIFHDYDYGTTTRVFLKGLKNYQLNLKEKIILLSRNEPLKLMCATCKKKPAVNICTTCNYDDYSFFCESCSEKHEKVCEDFADYSSMPIVNSPRMGECGYTGGVIDIERDGVYKKP